jgi:putative PEP-CTERM system integral membrane protein
MKLINFINRIVFNSVFVQILFWLWNLLFITIWIAAEVQGGFLWDMIVDALAGNMPLDILVTSFILVFTPLISLIVALTKLAGKKDAITKWFLCVEIPIMFLCLIRLTGLKELTAGNAHLLLVAALGIVTFIVYILRDKSFLNSKWLEPKMVGFTSILLLVFYLSLLVSFFIIPLLAIFLKAFFSFDWLTDWPGISELFWFILFFLFAAVSSILGAIYPIFSLRTYFKSFKEAFNHFKITRFTAAWLTVILTIVVNSALFIILNINQSQQYAFGLWDKLEKQNFPTELKEETRANETKVRSGIMNAYLAKYRYMFDKDDQPLKYLYKEAFGNDSLSLAVNDVFCGAAFPFVYQGNMYRDDDKARELYGNLFDESLHVAEKDRILHAMNSTWNRGDIEASILDINEQKVLITNQDVTVKEGGNFAQIEIHETYQNQTFRQQEILYYFSLPPNAVFTGLWLSDTDGIDKKYEYAVSPRGAAQQVYKDEVRRRVDPSLLEQVGPNQYRLRAFPILPKRWDYAGDYRSKRTEMLGDNFHLWLEYTVYSEEENWPSPAVIERRNVYQNEKTSYSYRDKQIATNGEDWIPYSLAKENATNSTEESSFEGKCVSFMKAEKQEVKPQRINVVVDNSYSMLSQIALINTTIAELKEVFGENNVKTYVETQETDAIATNMFWGDKQMLPQLYNNEDILNQAPSVYITDNGSYELLTDTLKSLQLNNPLYLLHLNENWPKAYSDNLYETLKLNGGGAAGSIEELVTQISSNTSDSNVISRCGGIAIEVYETSKKPCVIGPSAMADRIIASKLIDKMVKDVYTEDRLTALDKMHAYAKKHHIVTPYSSMIVLVNDRQKKALEDAENKDDRFDRENETGGEPDGKLSETQVTGTPEPEEWMLIILSGIMLFVLWYRKKYQVVQDSNP